MSPQDKSDKEDPHVKAEKISITICTNHNIETQEIWNWGNLTPPKVHSSSITKSKDIKTDGILGKECKTHFKNKQWLQRGYKCTTD
jgi:hypothetical protein